MVALKKHFSFPAKAMKSEDKYILTIKENTVMGNQEVE